MSETVTHIFWVYILKQPLVMYLIFKSLLVFSLHLTLYVTYLPLGVTLDRFLTLNLNLLSKDMK